MGFFYILYNYVNGSSASIWETPSYFINTVRGLEMKYRHSVDDILISFCSMIHGSVEHEEHQSVFKMSSLALMQARSLAGHSSMALRTVSMGKWRAAWPGPRHASESQH